GPHQSSQVLMPTVKAAGDNLPTSHLECAVQDSREAGNCVKAWQAERRLETGWMQGTDEQIKDPQNADDNALDINVNIPDLANLALSKEIEHLLALAEVLDSPVMLNLMDEPQTCKEAQQSADA
ncbi:hypothetical protein H0H87_006894, partial [Tephrocybe sp. NHM501043]